MCHKQMMSDMTNKTKCPPRSPFRRNRNVREPIRPRLSRSVIATARVNLNSYWSKFEELSNENRPLASQLTSMQDNEINDNLVNELVEICRL